MQEFGFSGAHEARERYALSGRQPFPRQPFCGATELRKQYAVAGLGISRSAERGNGPLARRAQKGRDTYGFPPSLNSYLSLGSLANGPDGPTS